MTAPSSDGARATIVAGSRMRRAQTAERVSLPASLVHLQEAAAEPRCVDMSNNSRVAAIKRCNGACNASVHVVNVDDDVVNDAVDDDDVVHDLHDGDAANTAVVTTSLVVVVVVVVISRRIFTENSSISFFAFDVNVEVARRDDDDDDHNAHLYFRVSP